MPLVPALKKGSILICSFFISLMALSQEMEFQLMNGEEPIDLDNCIVFNQDFDSNCLKLIKDTRNLCGAMAKKYKAQKCMNQ